MILVEGGLMLERKMLKTSKTILAMKNKKFNKAEVKQLCIDMLDWAEKDNSIILVSFYNQCGINEDKFDKLKKNNLNLRYTHEIVRLLIGYRRQCMIDSDRTDINKKSLRYVQHRYETGFDPTAFAQAFGDKQTGNTEAEQQKHNSNSVKLQR